MKLAVIAISFMLGLGFTTRYSGLDAVLGLAFTRTGWLFPFFGTFLGWLGVALTGSDPSSNALFGSLQRITAHQLNLDPALLRPYGFLRACCCQPLAPALTAAGCQMLIFRVSGIRNRLSTKATAGTVMG